MISAILLLTLGAVDAVIGLASVSERPRSASAAIPGRWIAAAIAVTLPVAGWLWLATPPLWAATVAASGLVWLWLGSRHLRGRGHVAFLVAAVAVVPLVALAMIAERPTLSDSPAARGFADATAGAGFQGPALSLVVAALAAVILLTRTANLVCRAAFGRAMTTDRVVEQPENRRWKVAVGSREVGSVIEVRDQPESVAPATPALRGGRVIGPLERILIVALALTGAEAVVVGLLAAKGIVRFPEISADGRRGSKAEEFLIGSLVSWTIAGLAAAYLAVQRIG